jgi:membrane-bound serine protease (ClpP class)
MTRAATARLRAALAVLAFAVLSVFTEPSRAGSGPILHLTIDGVINPIKARYVRQAVEEAESAHAAFVLVSIDTPGGLVSSMQEIVGSLSNARIPIVGLVEPRAAQATSAGAFILLATDVAAMLPDTRVGAAHPVGAGESLKGAMEQKATNSLASLAKSLARRRGRNETAAEAIVRESTSYTADEAKKEKLVEIIANDRGDLLAKLDGYELDFPDEKARLSTRHAIVMDRPLSFTSRVLDAAADPTLASILLTIGVLGILYELSAPGIGMGGIIGVSALLLGLLGMSVLPIDLVGFLLLLVGFVAMALEVKFPTHGLLGLGGVAALVIGALVLVDEARYFGGAQKVDFRVFAPVVLVLAAGLLGLAAVARKTLGKPPKTGVEALVGMHGTAKTTFEIGHGGFVGSVFVDGARWQAVADSEIESGDRVAVTAVLGEPRRLRVRPLGEGET